MKLRFFMILVALSILACNTSTNMGAPSRAPAEENTTSKKDIPRIAVAEAYKKVKSGDALLVCAYASARKCSTLQLEGSISLMEFESKIQSIEKDQEIIFFCA